MIYVDTEKHTRDIISCLLSNNRIPLFVSFEYFCTICDSGVWDKGIRYSACLVWVTGVLQRCTDPQTKKTLDRDFFLHPLPPQIHSIIFDIAVRKLPLIHSAHFLSNCWCIWLKLMNSMTELGNHFSSHAIHISRVICNSVRQTGPKFGKKSIWLPYFIVFWFCMKNELSGRCVLTQVRPSWHIVRYKTFLMFAVTHPPTFKSHVSHH